MKTTMTTWENAMDKFRKYATAVERGIVRATGRDLDDFLGSYPGGIVAFAGEMDGWYRAGLPVTRAVDGLIQSAGD